MKPQEGNTMEKSSVFKSKGKEYERVLLTEIELKDRVIRLETYKENDKYG